MEAFIIAAITCIAGTDCQEIRLSPNKTFETREQCEDSSVTLWLHPRDSIAISCVSLREWEARHPSPQGDKHG